MLRSFFFFSSRRRHTRYWRDWSSDVCSSDLSRSLEVSVDRFPIAGALTIARGPRTEAVVVTATIRDGDAIGRGECVPYPRYGETVEGVAAAIEALRDRVAAGLTREAVQAAMPPGAARNARD